MGIPFASSEGEYFRIVDEGVLGVNNGGVSNLHLVWMLGLQMTGFVLFGGLCGSLNNAFVHISSQNIGNEIRKDCFRRIMAFSFPQIDCFGTGSLVTRSCCFRTFPGGLPHGSG